MLDTDVVPLGPEDRAILALESATVAGHTCKVIRLGPGAPDVAALRERLGQRLEHVPELRRRLGGPADAPCWTPDLEFDVADHVVAAPVAEPVDHAGLPEVVAGLFAQRLDRARPLWRIDVVPLAGGGAALVWRIHHALADGTTSVRLGRALLWDDPPAPAAHRAASEDDQARRRRHLAAFLHREFARARGVSPFDGAIGTRREVGFGTVSLRDLHDAAKAYGATVNDAVLAAVGGGLRAWIERHHGELGQVRVRVPVSLHHEGDSAANHDSFFSLRVFVTERDPVARLQAIHAATARRKAEHDAEERERLLEELAGVSPRMSRWAASLEDSPRRFALSVSNVPGPRAPVTVLGAPVTALHSLAEIGERHGLRATAVSLCDDLCLGFCADPALVPDVQQLADDVSAEARALIDRAPAI